MTFVALMRQECAFYDDEDHSSAALSARLTGDAANVQSVSFKRLFFSKNLIEILSLTKYSIQNKCQLHRSLAIHSV